MSALGKWAKKHLAVRLDSHTLGNLTKNVAPVAGAVIGGPLGLAAAGGLGAAGELGRGKNIGEAAHAGLSSAGQAGIGMAAKGLLAGAGSSAASGGSAALDSAPSSVGTGGLTLPSTPALTGSGGIGTAGRTALAFNQPAEHGILYRAGQGALNAGEGLAGFAGDHPNAAAGALSAFGGLGGQQADQRLHNDQSDLLEQQRQEQAAEIERQTQRRQALSTAFSAFGPNATIQHNTSPYTVGR